MCLFVGDEGGGHGLTVNNFGLALIRALGLPLVHSSSDHGDSWCMNLKWALKWGGMGVGWGGGSGPSPRARWGAEAASGGRAARPGGASTPTPGPGRGRRRRATRPRCPPARRGLQALSVCLAAILQRRLPDQASEWPSRVLALLDSTHPSNAGGLAVLKHGWSELIFKDRSCEPPLLNLGCVHYVADGRRKEPFRVQFLPCTLLPTLSFYSLPLSTPCLSLSLAGKASR